MESVLLKILTLGKVVFFFSTTELTKPTETSPHLQIQAVSDNPRHSIDQRMIM